MHRLVIYVKPLNGDWWDIEELKTHFEHFSGPDFVTIGETSTCDIGEWADDHPLNYEGADHERWFREAKP